MSNPFFSTRSIYEAVSLFILINYAGVPTYNETEFPMHYSTLSLLSLAVWSRDELCLSLQGNGRQPFRRSHPYRQSYRTLEGAALLPSLVAMIGFDDMVGPCLAFLLKSFCMGCNGDSRGVMVWTSSVGKSIRSKCMRRSICFLITSLRSLSIRRIWRGCLQQGPVSNPN